MDDGMHHGTMGDGEGGMDMQKNNTNNKMMMMMHMTFFWGDRAEILFSGWPGTSTGMYILALIFVFLLSVLVEWLSRLPLIKPGSNHVAAGFARTLMHTIRVGLAYLVMLAVMSFNGGVFLAAVAGHSIGFLVFGSQLVMRTETGALPDMGC
ncbi:Ctr copper transporter [Macleaya cordata]|uniref:Copper transport protein n=1 Tax=Macleaya cordata TaxID=56857 RepID=A0A200R4U3_MACCD|nr:Ctr copper transporter [Macleaya cordata]